MGTPFSPTWAMGPRSGLDTRLIATYTRPVMGVGWAAALKPTSKREPVCAASGTVVAIHKAPTTALIPTIRTGKRVSKQRGMLTELRKQGDGGITREFYSPCLLSAARSRGVPHDRSGNERHRIPVRHECRRQAADNGQRERAALWHDIPH